MATREPSPVRHGESGESDLAQWWSATAGRDATAVVPKAIEYGSRDLTEMGRTLVRVGGREADDAYAAEVGAWFYALGKMARWTAAIERGDRVSEDTLVDLSTYVMMVRRIRDAGSWPGDL